MGLNFVVGGGQSRMNFDIGSYGGLIIFRHSKLLLIRFVEAFAIRNEKLV
jgi:hypothetical protein